MRPPHKMGPSHNPTADACQAESCKPLVFDAKAKSASLSTSLFRPNLNAVGELEGLHWGGMMLLPSELPRRAPTSATAAVPKYPPFAEGLAHGLNRPKAEVSARYAIG